MLTIGFSINRVGGHIWDESAVAREKKDSTSIGNSRPSFETRSRRTHPARDRHATFRTPTTKVFSYG